MVFFELVDFGFVMVWRSVWWLAGWLAGNRVALYSILCVGAVVLYSSGTAYFLMIWALARLLAQCGEVFCFV